MATIEFLTGDKVPPFVQAGEFRDSASYRAASHEDVVPDAREWESDPNGVAVRMYYAGSADEPQLFEVRLEPNYVVERHAHHADEIIYVTQGEIRFGSVVCPVGSSIRIPKITLYGFTSGPEGAQFLNFRPCAALGVITIEEFRELRQTKES
jgi:hypothetical protein